MSVDFVRGCYYTNWAVYRPEPYNFPPERVPIDLCTHIFYAFAAINAATWEARMTDQWADEGKHGFEKFYDLKKQKPGTKTLLSFGGWTESLSGVYAIMASDPNRRATFIRSAWQMANKWGFDGIDMDWEYPDSANRANFVLLIKELKAAGRGKLVTAAVSAGIDKIDAGYDVAGFKDHIDFVTVMTYDFHGTWENIVGHHSGLPDTEKALAHWNSKGMPKEKILMGIGSYGRGWVADSCQPGTPAKGPSPAQTITKDNGIASFFELMKLPGCVVNTFDGPFWETSINGNKVCFGFDDRESILKKMELVRSQGYAGAFTWTIDFDDSQFTVHRAIKDGLDGTSTDPVVPTPPSPLSPSSPSSRRPSIPITQPPSSSCSTGQLRLNVDVTKYEECLYGSWIVRPCPPGTLFDPNTNNFKLP